ncbi:sulfatase [Halorarum halophilum]|uniref:Sulfatase n=1 Tax=Halorarum halophilum TaxID=2743090 RepID=A0A7D5GFB7_9EURY|nr:sulfatase [Halobaculum halophilum]QLG27610.1 sulfatase [Halobaculum halophilum]
MTGRPNVVLVVMDTMRARDASEDVAPTLTALGREGTLFANAFSSAPWTVPSHGSLFTGTYSSKHGTHGENPALGTSLRTLPECFSDAGYETVGFSNNTWITDEFDFDRGFDRLHRGWQYVQSDVDLGPVVRSKSLSGTVEAARERLFEGSPLVNVANLLYSEVFQPAGADGGARTNDHVRRWLGGRDDDRPFFLFLNFLEPHVPYDPPREHAEPYLPDGVSYEEATEIRQEPRAFDVGEYDLSDEEFAALRGLYRGEMSYVDEHLAELRTALADAGEWDDTVIAVCGDHGENVGDHGLFGHQYNVYDTALHVPLVVSGGSFDGDCRREELVQLLDLPATLLDAAGIDAPAFRDQQQGRSLHSGATSEPREAVFAEYLAPQPPMEALESRFGEAAANVSDYYRTLRTVRTRRWKYVRGGDGERELYRVDRDPYETVDRSAEEPRVVRRLDDRLDEWLASFEHADPDAGAGDDDIADATLDRLAELGYR